MEALETNREGLLNLAEAGFRISVSPELLLRGINAYDAVIRGTAERGWPLKIVEGACLKIVIRGQSLKLAVTENTDPLPNIQVRPGERRPRKPAGNLAASLATDYKGVKVGDNRAGRIEARLPELFNRAEELGGEICSEHEHLAAVRRQQEMEDRHLRELDVRIARLGRDFKAWAGAKQIREYVEAVKARLLEDGAIPADSESAKWLSWALQEHDYYA